jgi:hypothetical protein
MICPPYNLSTLTEYTTPVPHVSAIAVVETFPFVYPLFSNGHFIGDYFAAVA